VLHLACHGVARLGDPLESGLLLAGHSWLTLRELIAMRLNARLAVLSACETSRPGTELPDEVVALPTGLLQAGVASVIASLWAVPDFETALLMARFYGGTLAMSPAAALQEAQQWMRDTSDEDKLADLEQACTGEPPWLEPDLAEVFSEELRRPAPEEPVGFRNSVSLRGSSSSTRCTAELVSPGFQGLISRDRLCAVRQANRARLTSTRRIWYSRARVKLRTAYLVRYRR